MTTASLDLPDANSATGSADFPNVIRRDIPGKTDQKPRIVPWLGHKIARAVDAACAAVGTEKMLGSQVLGEIEFRMRREQPLFIHIEQLQDTVEDTLLELGHPRVALAYAKYRGKRAAMRELELGDPEDDHQLELISTELIADIRERVSFAKIGLNMTLTDGELITRLLRSASVARSSTSIGSLSLRSVMAESPVQNARCLKPDHEVAAAHVDAIWLGSTTLPRD